MVGGAIFNVTYQRTSVINADREILAANFEELESVSDLIIKATVQKGKENVLIYDDGGDEVFGYTLTSLVVTQVYKGDVSKGDFINITEEYYATVDVINGNVRHIQGSYVPAKEKSEYIFYLKKYGDDTTYKDMYFPVDLENGKYVVNRSLEFVENIENLTGDDLEVGDRAVEQYKKLYESVINKYIAVAEE